VLEGVDHIGKWAIFSTDAELPATTEGGQGPGAWVRWEGRDDQYILLSIMESDAERQVRYHLDMNEDAELTVTASIDPPAKEGESLLELKASIQPDTLSGRWFLFLVDKLTAMGSTGGQSLADVLDLQLEKLGEYMLEIEGHCPAVAPGMI
jgi:hypothetical protein